MYDDLLSGHNTQIRPVEKSEDKIELRLGIKLSQISDIVIIILFINYFFTAFMNYNNYFIKGWTKPNHDN